MKGQLQTRDAYHRYPGKVFLLCLLTAGLMILPFLITGEGRFAVFADFNEQQVPFNMLCNQAIKNGDIYWNWYTDLGSNFIGAYSFYTLGSPFFWLSLLFPASWFPYLIGPLLMLKYAVAGLTSYAYLQRFVENKNYAVIGALLYAFSGFQTVNLMFNHFHDVVAFFPLLLIGLEEMVEKKRPGVFALAVAVNAMVNFFFFPGEVIFLLLYFIVRFGLKKGFWRTYGKSLPHYAAESLLGVGLACFLLLPAVLFTLGNPRTGSFLSGVYALAYSDRAVYANLFKAVLFPAECPPHQASIEATNSLSVSAYLPVFGVSLTAACLLHHKKSFVSRILHVCVVFACIPLLNSAFYLFRSNYYARWFYMPVLMMVLASAIALDTCGEAELRRGLRWTAVLTGGAAAFLFLYPWEGGVGSAVRDAGLLTFYCVMAGLGLLITWLLLRFLRHSKRFAPAALAVVASFSIVLGAVHIHTMQTLDPQGGEVAKIGGELRLPAEENYRTIAYPANCVMTAPAPSIYAFHSTVNGSIFSFYHSLGFERGHSSSELSLALDCLLSVRFRITVDEDTSKTPYATFDTGKVHGYVYEMEPFLPIGFSYDSFITPAQLESVEESLRPYLLLRAVVLEEEDAAAYADRLKPLPAEQFENLDDAHMAADIAARQKEASTYFDRYNEGFTARIACDRAKMLFFSVPYDTGWRATVNGKPVEIANADGLMAVPGEAGDNEVVFTYETPGLKAGVCITALSAVLLLAYGVGMRRREKQKAKPDRARP